MNTRTETLGTESMPTALYVPGLPNAPMSARRGGERLPVAARSVLAMLDDIRDGQIMVTLPDGGQHLCGQTGSGPIVDMVVYDWAVFGEIVARGDIGAAECFIVRHRLGLVAEVRGHPDYWADDPGVQSELVVPLAVGARYGVRCDRSWRRSSRT